MTTKEVKLILENQQVIMNALGNMTKEDRDFERLGKQIEKNIPYVHDKKKVEG